MSVAILSLPLAAVSLLVAAGSAALLIVVVRLGLLGQRKWRSSSLFASTIVLPAFAGALSAIALVVPNPLGACHCLAHGLHHPHLCALHPELASPLLIPAAGVVAGFAVLVIPRLIALVRSARETARFAAAVRSVTPVLVDGLAIRLLDIGAARAFSIGILHPVIVADLELWASLSEQERRAVVHHENGHIERRDGLTLLVLRLLTALCPWTFGAPLMQGWRAAAERACDSHAARVLKDPMLVAEALITVERARAVSAQSARTPGLALGVGDCCCLDQRVRALLEEPQRAPELGNDLLALAILFIGALGLAIAWPGDAFHHAVETVLGLTIS